MGTNFIGAYNITNAFANYIRENKFSNIGAIIEIGSTSAWHGQTGSEIYAASKSALQRMASVQAAKFAKEKLIHLNTIVCGSIPTELLMQAPSGIEKLTNQTPTGRLTTPEEVGEIAYFLIKNRCLNIVGAEIQIDGGRILSL